VLKLEIKSSLAILQSAGVFDSLYIMFYILKLYFFMMIWYVEEKSEAVLN
jgi:hypothetical protein